MEEGPKKNMEDIYRNQVARSIQQNPGLGGDTLLTDINKDKTLAVQKAAMTSFYTNYETHLANIRAAWNARNKQDLEDAISGYMGDSYGAVGTEGDAFKKALGVVEDSAEADFICPAHALENFERDAEASYEFAKNLVLGPLQSPETQTLDDHAKLERLWSSSSGRPSISSSSGRPSISSPSGRPSISSPAEIDASADAAGGDDD